VRVLLVRPPVFCSSLDYPRGPRFGVAVGLLYLAASLQATGREAAILRKTAIFLLSHPTIWLRLARGVVLSARTPADGRQATLLWGLFYKFDYLRRF
jgi:hypothetical protein